MSANSPARRLLKRILFPRVGARAYRYIQAVAKAWDIATGAWSETELDLIPLAVRPGDSAIDIGANYGLYSFHLSRAVGRSGRVHAFEPVPSTHAALSLISRFLRLRNVDLIAKGCSTERGCITFALPVQPSGAIIAGLVHQASRDDDRAGRERHEAAFPTSEIVCDVVAIDDFLPDLSRVSFIKCDIEGAELLALRGARKTIEIHHPTVVCEINPWYMEGFGIRLEDLAGFFRERGYAMYRYAASRGRRCLTPAAVEGIVPANYVFLHPDRLCSLAAVIASPERPEVRAAA